MKLVFLIVLLFSKFAFGCDEGFIAFQSSVYPKIIKDCAKCHDGSHTAAPAFAVKDFNVSYQSILNYMNFNNLNESLLVIRAGNGHCGLENCEEESGLEMLKFATQWWQSGEKSCLRNGRYFTEEIPIPTNLPGPTNSFATMRFDLSSIDSKLAGTSFEIGIQNYAEAGEGTSGAYRVRSPRFVNGRQSIFVKDVKVLLNGKYDPVFNIFTTIQKSVSMVPVTADGTNAASPMLSAHSMILLKDGLDSPKLSISFDRLETAAASSCLNPDKFSNFSKNFQLYSCKNCHNGSAALGTQVFNMNTSEARLCQISSELIAGSYPMISPLIAFPKNGTFGHPQLTAEQSANFLKAVNVWISQ